MTYVVELNGQVLFTTENTNPQTSIINPTLKLALNDAGSFTADIAPTHPLYDDVETMADIDIYCDNQWLWSGRIVEVESDFWKVKSIYCEGALAFLNDSIQPPHRYQYVGGTAYRQYLEAVIAEHNSQVEANRRFQVGIVEKLYTGTSFYRYTNYESTFKEIKDDLIADAGGYIRIRKDDGVFYLDYIANYNTAQRQTISFGENLLDFARNVTAGDIATRVIPLGATLEGQESAEGLDARLTIAAVNDGKVYLEAPAAVERYGKITKVVTFDTINNESLLKSRGQQWLSDSQWESVVFDVSCIDLLSIEQYDYLVTSNDDTLLTSDGDRFAVRDGGYFRVGDSIHVISTPHGLNAHFPLSEMTINIADPSTTVITLGVEAKQTSISGAQSKTSEALNTLKEEKIPTQEILEAAQRNATELINTQTHGFVVLEPNRILIMDARTIEDATNIWQWNSGGLGHSSDGGATYGDAAITMDGAINAKFITAGQMSANHIYGGVIRDTTGVNYWNLATGEFHMQSSSARVVRSVLTEYGVSDTSTDEPLNWSTGTPSWEQGKFIWARTTTTYSDNTYAQNAVCIQGARGLGTQILGTKQSQQDLPASGNAGDVWLINGDGWTWDATANDWVNVGRIQGPQGATGAQGPRGADGVSVVAIYPVYALHTSSVTEPADNKFNPAIPKWVEGKYIWTAQRIEFSSGDIVLSEKYCDINLNTVNEKWKEVTENDDELTRKYNEMRHDISFSWLMSSETVQIGGSSVEGGRLKTSDGHYIDTTKADAVKIGEDITQKLSTQIHQTAEQIEQTASETYTKKTETDNAITTLSNHYDTVIAQTAEQIRLDAVLEGELDGKTFEKTAAGIVIKPDKVTQLVSNAITQDYSSQEQTAYSLTRILNGFNSSITNIVARNAEADKLAMRFGLAVSWSTEDNPVRLITRDERLVIGFHGDIFNRLKDLNSEIATAIQQLDDRIALVARNESDDIAAIQVYADHINMTVSDVDNHVSTVEQKADRIEYRLANSNHFTFGENGLELKLGENGGLKWTNDNKLIVSDLDISATTLHITIADVENLEGALESLEITDEGIRTRWNNVAEVVAINTISSVPGLRIYSDKNNQTSLTLQSEFTGTRTTFYKGYAETWGGSSHNPKLLQIDKDNGITMYAPGYFPIIGYRDMPIAQFTSDAISFGTQLSTTVFVVENCRIDEDGLTLKAGPYAHRYDVFSAGENGMVWREQLTWDDGTGTSTYVHTPVAKYQVASDGTATWYQDLVRSTTTHTGRTQKHYHYRKAELSDSSFTIYQKLETSVPDANLNEYIQVRIGANGLELYPPYQSIISDFNTNSPWGQIFGAQFTQQAADAFAQIWSDGHSVLNHALVISSDKDADYGDSGGIVLNASLSALSYSSTFCLEPEGARLVARSFRIDGDVDVPGSHSLIFKDSGDVTSASILGASGRINARMANVTRGYGFIVSGTYYDNVLTYNRSSSSSTTSCNSDYFQANILSCNEISARNGNLSITGNTSINGTLETSNGLTVTNGISCDSLTVNGQSITGGGGITEPITTTTDITAPGFIVKSGGANVVELCGYGNDWSRLDTLGKKFAFGYDNGSSWVSGFDFMSTASGGYFVFRKEVDIEATLGVKGNLVIHDGYVSVDGVIVHSSDVRLKKNISPSTVKALEALTALDIKSFDWVKDEKHVEAGIIAQQLQKVAPNLVIDNDDTLYINQTELTYYLVKAIQELADMVGYKPKKRAEWKDPYTLEEKLEYNRLHSHT